MILVRVSPGCHPGEAAKIAAGPLACCQPSSSSSCSILPFTPFPAFTIQSFIFGLFLAWIARSSPVAFFMIQTESNVREYDVQNHWEPLSTVVHYIHTCMRELKKS